jgi:hypothetical protein
VAGPKFQLRSRTWNVITGVAVAVLLVAGFGGLFVLQSGTEPSGGSTGLFLIVLGVVTFLLFAGPGLVYPGRKRREGLKKRLPGGTMAWIRSHMYLPIIALAAAFVHAVAAPFRDGLSSGKVLLVVGVLVVVAGLSRHHLIGLKKEALNVNVEINKLTVGKSRALRNLVTDLQENRRPLRDIEHDVAELDAGEQALWRQIRQLSDEVHSHFPREGGQRMHVIHWQLWRMLHVPLTIGLFVILAYHIYDVLGGQQAVFGDDKSEFATVDQCAECHSEITEEWRTAMHSRAQLSTTTEGQLPVTLGRNIQLAEQLGDQQQERLETFAKVCINCHSPIGAQFEGDLALYPFRGGTEATDADGVSCVVCHTQGRPPIEMAAAGPLGIDNGGAGDFGTQFGPVFEDPDPLPVRIHGIGNGDGGFWNRPVTSSLLCGSCHNVKADMNGNGLTPFDDAEEDIRTEEGRVDSDGDFQLDQNELDFGEDANGDGTGDQGLQDLVLQTTFDEWQDYVAGFDARFGENPNQPLDEPLGCVECHMPAERDREQGSVDHAPGLLSIPERRHQSHAFVGVDYDLAEGVYEGEGLPENALEEVLAERQALLQSAVTVQVDNKPGPQPGTLLADVTVRNNFLGHAFPTGFAFARQFWLEVSAQTTSGQPVCLIPLTVGLDGRPLRQPIPSPCASGVVREDDDDLPTCDPQQVAALDPTRSLDAGIRFATPVPVGDCDPWLTNWQKILTDGDPDGDGVFTEVAFQSFLPDIVKLRHRVVNNQTMRPLESVRTGPNGEDLSADSYAYVFDVSQVPPGQDVVVTAKMRFRHLPPDFLRSLEAEQAALEESDVEGVVPAPEGAEIDAQALLENMVVTDVMEARSGEGAVLACEGPQNEEGASILDCLEEEGEGEEALGGGARMGADLTVPVAFATQVFADEPSRPAARLDWIAWLAVLASFTAATALLRRRLWARLYRR